jgi:DNA-binding NarL/FixJ family response regulator
MIKVVIAEELDLVRAGLRCLLNGLSDVEIVAEVANSKALKSAVQIHLPDIVYFNYTSLKLKLEDIPAIHAIVANVKFIALTDSPEKKLLENALRSGVNGHLLRCCDQKEVYDSIYETMKGNRFFCGKVLAVINDKSINTNVVTCAPISLSNRELEIIGHIADGMTNKEVADKLFLSSHTVNTHRKNLMAKLGVNNTAGIVIYAVKEGLISPNKYLFSPQDSLI